MNLQNKRENTHPDSGDLKQSETYFTINIDELFRELKKEMEFTMFQNMF